MVTVRCKIEIDHFKRYIFAATCQFCCQNRGSSDYQKKEAIERRARVNRLYYEAGLSKREIHRQAPVSWQFIIDWTQSPTQDFEADERGWTKGRRRKWNAMLEERIKTIREEFEADPDQFYIGPTAIQVEYHRRYPAEELPPVRTIGQVLSDLGLSHTPHSGRNTGAAQYLRYPEWTIYEWLGSRVLEADFVGEKFITGHSSPIHFIGYAFKKAPRLRHFKRVDGETTDVFIQQTTTVFERFEKPDIVKIDNAMAMIGGRRGKRTISRGMLFLLTHQVYPVFSVPRKPFTQASIEGSNSVFARKFWNQCEFSSVEEIDERLEAFNQSTRRYLQYEPPAPPGPSRGDFEPKVYFTRQVHQADNEAGGVVHILGETIQLPTSYVKYFILGEWNLVEERLCIRFEKEKESTIIKELDFPINKNSKEKCSNLLK